MTDQSSETSDYALCNLLNKNLNYLKILQI